MNVSNIKPKNLPKGLMPYIKALIADVVFAQY
ncbi:hypothetical protein HNP72_003248 [Sphingobacterium soli]|nr:hypothetical protein [Sphingobacterium soli]